MSFARPRLIAAVLALALVPCMALAPTAGAANQWDLDTSYPSPSGPGHFEADLSQHRSIGTNRIDQVKDIAIDSSGRSVVVGSVIDGTTEYLVVARYLPSGILDAGAGGFSGDGYAELPPGANGNSVAIQPDGKIVVAGYLDSNNNDDLLIARFNADGTLDTTGFNSPTGYVTANLNPGNDVAYSVAIRSNGEIWVAGETGNTDRDVVIYGVVASGGVIAANIQIDANQLVTGLTGADGARDIIYDSSTDAFTVAGFHGSPSQFLVLQVDAATDALKTTFSGDGIATFGDATNEFAHALARNGSRILVVGTRTVSSGNDEVLVAAFDATSGSVDIGWNGIGSHVANVGPNAETVGDAVVSAGQLLVTGSTQTATGRNLMVLRYATTGALDTTWNTTGVVTTAPLAGSDTLRGEGIAVDGSSRIQVAGFASSATDDDTALVRYLGASAVATATSNVDLSGCPDANIDFGLLMPGSSAATSVDCVISFASTAPSGATLMVTRASANTVVVPTGATQINEYDPTTANWVAGASMFGICMTGGTAAPAWTIGDCVANGTGWRRVPPMGGAVEETAAMSSSPAFETARFRFGVKVPATQLAGAYSASIVFTVVANA